MWREFDAKTQGLRCQITIHPNSLPTQILMLNPIALELSKSESKFNTLTLFLLADTVESKERCGDLEIPT